MSLLSGMLQPIILLKLGMWKNQSSHWCVCVCVGCSLLVPVVTSTVQERSAGCLVVFAVGFEPLPKYCGTQTEKAYAPPSDLHVLTPL